MLSDDENIKGKIHEVLANALKTNDEDLIRHALNVVREKGTEQIIPDLVGLLRENKDHFIRKNIREILSDIKSPLSGELIIEQIREPKNQEIRPLLLSICWESGVDMKKYLDFFVELAATGDFYVAVEVNTIIGEIEPPVDKEILKNAKAILAKALRKNMGEKEPILENIQSLLKDLSAKG